MPWYKYTIIDQQGKFQSLSNYFASEETFKKQTKNCALISYKKIFRLRQKIPKQDIIDFSFYMHKLLQSKVHLTHAIEFTIDTLPTLSTILSDIKNELEMGRKLSAILKTYPHIFDHIVIAHIEFGESVGKLDTHFKHIYDHLNLKTKTQSEIRNSLIYPAIIGAFIFILLFCTDHFILPEFIDFLRAQNKTLPLSTKILIQFIFFTSNILPFILLSFSIGILLCYKFNKYWFDKLILRLPFIGTLLYKNQISMYLQIISVFLKEKIPILDALRKANVASKNSWMQEQFKLIENDVENGENLHSALSRIVKSSKIIKIAEDNNFLETTLERVADMHRQEVRNFLRKLIKCIEPTLIITFGLIILLIVLAIWSPLYETI